MDVGGCAVSRTPVWRAAAGERVLPLLVRPALSFWSRFWGWMFAPAPKDDEGLLLSPCRRIHTFGMRFAIDAVYLDGDGRILAVEEGLMPGRTGGSYRGCCRVLELKAGAARRFGLNPGETLTFFVREKNKSRHLAESGF